MTSSIVQVLSVVATQVKTVQDCIKKLAVVSNRDPEYQHLPPGLPPVKIGNFMFEGDMISLTPSKTYRAMLCCAMLLSHTCIGAFVSLLHVVLSCLVLSCLVLSCLVLSCLVLSCLVLSCLVLSFFF
jgi:hypothetical protein